MEVFGFKDIILYFVITSFYIVIGRGLKEYFRLLYINGRWLFLTLPYRLLTQRYYNPFPYQSIVSQRATNKEVFVIEMLKYYLVSGSTSDGASRMFFLDPVFRCLNRIRRWRYLGEGLGDISSYNVDQDGGVKGQWIYSKSRVSTSYGSDIVLFFVPGSMGGYGGNCVQMYTEYLSILTLNLLEQGFGNPLVFIPEVPNDLQLYPQIQHFLLKTYQYVQKCKISTSTQVVLGGDSSGATLALTLLLQVSEPSPMVLNYAADEVDFRTLKMPNAVMLISPITDIDCTETSNYDYLSGSTLAQWRRTYVPDHLFATPEQRLIELQYYNPGQSKNSLLWKRILSVRGIFISYGTEELLGPQTARFALFLADKCQIRVRLDKQTAQVHNWAIISFYTENRVDHREVSLQTYSGVLSRMLLWDSAAYYNLRTKEPTNIITLDEDHT